MEESKLRMQWIDVARGFAMLLVIWGHLDTEHTIFFTWTNAIKLPLFFAISGYLINIDSSQQIKFLTKKAKGLIWPYFALGGLSTLISLLKDVVLNHKIHTDLLVSFFMGKEFWFIPCLFICMVYIYGFSKLARGKFSIFLVASLITFFLSFFVLKENQNVFYRIDLALFVQFFVCVGMFLKQYSEKLVGTKKIILGIGVYCIVTILLNWLIPGYEFDLNREIFIYNPFCAIHMIIGILASLLLFKEVGNHKNAINSIIAFIGRHTLCYFIFSFQCMHVTLKVINMSSLRVGLGENTLYVYLITFILMLVELGLISIAVDKAFPFLLGKPKVNKTN